MTEQPEPQTPDQPQAAPPQELDDVWSAIKQHGGPVLTGALIGIVVVAGLFIYRGHNRSVVQQASLALTRAQGMAEIQDVAATYAKTPVGPIAQLAVASDHYNRARYDEARQTYLRFMETHSDHPLRPTAEYGEAVCLEAIGEFEEALQNYTAFVELRGDHYLGPMAYLGRARSLTQLGRLEEARIMYEDFIAAYPESPWLSDAQTQLSLVQKDLRGGGMTTATLPQAVPLALPTAPEPVETDPVEVEEVVIDSDG